MDILTVLVLLAVIATLISLVSGVASMATDGQVAHRKSAEWMNWRVTFQGVALLLILLAILVGR